QFAEHGAHGIRCVVGRLKAEVGRGGDVTQHDQLTGDDREQAIDRLRAKHARPQHGDDEPHPNLKSEICNLPSHPRSNACPKLMNHAVRLAPGCRLTLNPRSKRNGPNGDLYRTPLPTAVRSSAKSIAVTR